VIASRGTDALLLERRGAVIAAVGGRRLARWMRAAQEERVEAGLVLANR